MSTYPVFRSLRAKILAFGIAGLALTTSSASAFCGLQSCPKPTGSGETPRFEAALRTRVVSYDIGNNEGHYLVTAPRVFLNYGGFALGAEVPFTRLDNGGTVSTGLSNPLVTGRYARRLSHAWSGEVGLQWELPIGNQKDGLAGDHNMLLPWLGLRRDLGHVWYATGMVGVSTALEDAKASAPVTTTAQIISDPSDPTGTSLSKVGKTAHAGHDHGATPVLVNPHADRELQGRLAVGWIKGRGTFEGYGLSQTDLTSSGPETYARAGVSYEWSLMRFTALQIIGDLPVTAARRNEAEVGVTIKTGW